MARYTVLTKERSAEGVSAMKQDDYFAGAVQPPPRTVTEAVERNFAAQGPRRRPRPLDRTIRNIRWIADLFFSW